jgi:hypothetical protein
MSDISKSASEAAEKCVKASFSWRQSDALNSCAEIIQSAIDTEIDTEQGRWQETIYNLVTKETGQLHPPPMIDGAGCDSGDPLDFTLSEIQQAIGAWEDHAAKLHTARQKDAEMIAKLEKDIIGLMDYEYKSKAESDSQIASLTKQVEELQAKVRYLDQRDVFHGD